MAPDSDDNSADEEEPNLPAETGSHEVSLSLDAILSLLADPHRRDFLRYLVETPGETCSLDECVSHLVQRNAERDDKRRSRDQVGTMLHHQHIPMLDDAGVLEYDSRSQEIRYRGHDQLESWLERIHADETASD